jgi:hypothetical protein
VATEKAQQAVLKGVEDFDPSQLKHAETQEKIILPDAEGNVVVVVHIVAYDVFSFSFCCCCGLPHNLLREAEMIDDLIEVWCRSVAFPIG